MENNRKEKQKKKPSNKAEIFLIPVLQVRETKNQGDTYEQKIVQEVITQWVYNKLGTETWPVWERWAHWAKNQVHQLKQKKKQKNETKRSKMHMNSIWFNCSTTDTYIQCIRPKNFNAQWSPCKRKTKELLAPTTVKVTGVFLADNYFKRTLQGSQAKT